MCLSASLGHIDIAETPSELQKTNRYNESGHMHNNAMTGDDLRHASVHLPRDPRLNLHVLYLNKLILI
jgi:hypothetical protein